MAVKTRVLTLVALCAALGTASAAASVVTYHNSIQRSGAYTIPSLTLTAAANMRPDPNFNATVSGNIYAQPLYWKPNIKSSGQVIVATESNTVYAVDETTGALVWQTVLSPSVPLAQLPCGNIDPMGITGTPVIDPKTRTLYLDAMTETDSGPRQLVYALSLLGGSIVPGWPIDMQALLTEAGASFDSTAQGERSALLFFKGKLYVNYGGQYGDCGSYFGTVSQINPSSAEVESFWQTRASGGGIWAQGGIAGDGKNLFVTTGNTFGPTQWSDGEAIIRLLPGLAHSASTKDFFTPSNWKDLDNSDKDLGGTEAIPIDVVYPRYAKRVIAFGKDGNVYLTNRGNLGGVGGQIQTLLVSNQAVRTAPAVLETISGTMVAFANNGSNQCGGANITMLNIAPRGSSPITVAWCAQYSGFGAPIITTTDGAANALVWTPGAEDDNLLHGFNAVDGSVVFSGTGTLMSGLHHFQTILATPNRFYIAGDNKLYSFMWQ